MSWVTFSWKWTNCSTLKAEITDRGTILILTLSMWNKCKSKFIIAVERLFLRTMRQLGPQNCNSLSTTSKSRKASWAKRPRPDARRNQARERWCSRPKVSSNLSSRAFKNHAAATIANEAVITMAWVIKKISQASSSITTNSSVSKSSI